MGWLARRRVAAMTDPVDGTLTLTGTSPRPTLGVRVQSYAFTGVVQAPGVPATPVQLRGLAAPADRWPEPDATLPVVVDRADPQRVVIRWDRVRPGGDVAWQQAQAQALQAQTGVDPEVLARAISAVQPPAPARSIDDEPPEEDRADPT